MVNQKTSRLIVSVFTIGDVNSEKRYYITLEDTPGIKEKDMVDEVGGDYEIYKQLAEDNYGKEDKEDGYSFNSKKRAEQFLTKFIETLGEMK